jgi:hypothetical protein
MMPLPFAPPDQQRERALEILDDVERYVRSKLGGKFLSLRGPFHWSRSAMETIVTQWTNLWNQRLSDQELRRGYLSRPGPRLYEAEHFERELRAYLISISNAPHFLPAVSKWQPSAPSELHEYTESRIRDSASPGPFGEDASGARRQKY